MRTFFQTLSVILMPIMLSACFQVKNSNSNDDLVFSPVDSSSRLALAQRAMGANSCYQCHAGFAKLSESDFQSKRTSDGKPYIVPGKPEESGLYVNLTGAGGSMPLGNNAPMSGEDLAIIADWIRNVEAASTPVPTPTPTPTPVPGTPEEIRFASALTIIQTSCIRCHATGSEDGEFAGYTSEAQFKAAQTFDGLPLVTAKDLNNSPLFMRLSGSGGPDADMPKRAPPLSDADMQTIRDWIQNLVP